MAEKVAKGLTKEQIDFFNRRIRPALNDYIRITAEKTGKPPSAESINRYAREIINEHLADELREKMEGITMEKVMEAKLEVEEMIGRRALERKWTARDAKRKADQLDFEVHPLRAIRSKKAARRGFRA